MQDPCVCISCMVCYAPPTEHKKNRSNIWQLCLKRLRITSPLLFNTHTHTHANTLCTHWSPHPQLILLHLNQNKQPGGDKPLLFCTHLILLSIILISFLCLTRLLTMSGDQQNPRMVKQPRRSKRGFNSSFSRPILVSRVKTRQLRKCLAGQSKPLTVSFWEIRAWISPE